MSYGSGRSASPGLFWAEEGGEAEPPLCRAQVRGRLLGWGSSSSWHRRAAILSRCGKAALPPVLALLRGQNSAPSLKSARIGPVGTAVRCDELCTVLSPAVRAVCRRCFPVPNPPLLPPVMSFSPTRAIGSRGSGGISAVPGVAEHSCFTEQTAAGLCAAPRRHFLLEQQENKKFRGFPFRLQRKIPPFLENGATLGEQSLISARRNPRIPCLVVAFSFLSTRTKLFCLLPLSQARMHFAITSLLSDSFCAAFPAPNLCALEEHCPFVPWPRSVPC